MSASPCVRVLVAVALSAAAVDGFALESLRAIAQFVPLDSVQCASGSGTSPDLFCDVPLAQSAYTGLAGAINVGAAVNLAGAGPQARVTSVGLVVYSLRAAAYQQIQVELKFWNGFDAHHNPVFSKSAGTYFVDVTGGPFNFDANQAYSIELTLAKPVYLENMQGVAVSEAILVDRGDGNLVPSDTLVPALDTGLGAPATGTVIAAFGNAIESTDDAINFTPSDALGNGVRLAIALRGSSFNLVQCGDTPWPGFRDVLIEDFDDPTMFYQHWNVYANTPNNSGVVLGNGQIALSAPANNPAFPYVTSQGAPIPSTGDFSVRWLAQYTSAAGGGTGTLVIGNGLPANGSSTEPQRSAWVWQDTANGFLVNAVAGVAYQENPPQLVMHDVEFCWLDSTNSIELWVDGTFRYRGSISGEPRPDSLWFGNHVTGGSIWNDFTLQRVHVRAPAASSFDEIFANGFEAVLP